MVKRADKYRWEIGTLPPPIDPHSLVKHKIVRGYLERYIQVLMSNYNMEKLTLSIVDGFAGGGEYSSVDGTQFHEGSPLIALTTIAAKEVELNVGRSKPRKVDAKYYFVEKIKSNFDYLDQLLRARFPAPRFGSDIELLKGTFQEKANGIIVDIQRRAGGERAIFLLDQYAYDQVTGPMLKSIFSQVKGAEIILTFAVDSLISFLSDNEASRAKLAQMGMDAHIDWIALEALRSAPPATWRAAIQRNLAKGLIEASGAKNFTIFYITPMGNTSWTYWFIHLSNSAKARDVMMELHWQSANHFSHYLEPDIFTLGYQANLDRNATMQDALELGESHQFDALAADRCKSGLIEKLVPAIYNGKPTQFSQLLDSMGSLTPATADMIRDVLDPAIRCGDLLVRSTDGVKRAKGHSVKVNDVLERSSQMSLISLPGMSYSQL